ncbi:MAG: glycosyltransferase family 2 protein [Nitrospinae bacterium]|nr:glycosyltransferase family 2 protein [Nitrospinota bacterium]
MTIAVYFIYNLIFVLDLWDTSLRIYWRMKHLGPGKKVGGKFMAFPTSIPIELPFMPDEEKKKRLKPFVILVSVYNAEGYIREFLDKHRDYLDHMLIVDDHSTDQTYRILEEMGVRYTRNETNLKKPASIKRALKLLPPNIETVIVMDPDSHIMESGYNPRLKDLEEVLSDFQRSGASACAVRINLKEEKGLLSRLQELEYMICISLGRKSLLDKTVLSGIAIYHRKNLEQAMEDHLLSVYGEDFMTSLLILSNGGRIYYDGRVLVDTEGKPTIKGLISQRIGWDLGYIMVYFYTLARIMRKKGLTPLLLGDARMFVFYNYLVYLGVFGILSHPLKLVSIGVLLVSFANLAVLMMGLPLLTVDTLYSPLWFLSFYISYCILTGIMIMSAVQGAKRRRYWTLMPIYPFYALFLLIIRTIGFTNYISLLAFGKKIYHDHY